MRHLNVCFFIITSFAMAACDRTPVSDRGTVPDHASLAHSVAGCGATLDAPRGFRGEGVKRELEHLRLSGGDGVTVTVSCLEKSRAGPSRLIDHARWIAGELSKEDPTVPVDPDALSSTQQIDGHPVLALEIPADRQAKRSMLIFTERARAFYWVHYSSPALSWERDAKERAALLQSFRVTDPTADRGPTRWWRPEVTEAPGALSDARAAFHTKVRKGRPAHGFDGMPPPRPPRGTFEMVDVNGPVGRLRTYVSPDPKDGKRHPAVVWAHGGFGGIDSDFWDPAPRRNDQSARAFRDAGIILAVGSWRAENDNPGDYELFYGEVDDFIAVRDHVARLAYVDPDHIYLAGHSSGGTLVLLAAEKSDGFRAAFSIGGNPIFSQPETYARYGGVPFDASDTKEALLRSSAPFFRSIRRPTFYFEGRGGGYGGARWMADEATKAGVPLEAFLAMQADHFSILAPLTELIARKILADSGPTTTVAFTQQEIDALRVEE